MGMSRIHIPNPPTSLVEVDSNRFEPGRPIIQAMSFRAGALAAIGLAMVLVSPCSGAPATLIVAAASDLQAVLPEIAARFQRTTGQTLRLAFGSSGQFLSQIQNGAPIDVFLSADDAYVWRLVDSGHADRSTVTPYATGRIALWTRTDRGLDLTNGLSSLADPRIRRIAIANPEHAPYGRAAVEALRRAGVYDQVRTRLVLGENVSQAAQFAQTGNADVALIALSLTLAPAMRSSGHGREIAPEAYSPIRQTGVVVARSPSGELGRQFLAFLTQPEVGALLGNSGFGARP